jgi:RNA polymerase sigma factor (sigma-70 family)
MSSSALAAGLRHLRGKLAAQQHSDDSDEQLLHAFLASRDDNAFAVLVRRHGPMVLHLCRRVLGHEQDAEDAFQATFLVLSRQAARLRKKASLASWLHGIAYRLALKAKRAAARRRKHENSLGAQTRSRSPADPADDLSWREVRTRLDNEIAHLPEKYRSVFVLFYLEDCGREETARRLGLKEGTVASRLDKARKRLQQRLGRRGVELTAVLTATGLAAQTASAVPPGLMAATIKAASETAMDEGLAGVVSASVAELVKSATTAMLASKAKIATALLLAVGMLAGAGVWESGGFRILSGGRQPPETSPTRGADAPRSAKREAFESVQIRGRVLDPDGKPVKGARLYWPRVPKTEPRSEEDIEFPERAKTDADGRFRFELPRADIHPEWRISLIAAADDYGVDGVELPKDGSPADVTLRLVKDQPIEGRILSTEGKPLAGVRVRALEISTPARGRIDDFLSAWQQEWRMANERMSRYLYLPPLESAKIVTDKEGRFRITGAGSERLVKLRVSGPGVSQDALHVITRAGFDATAVNKAVLERIPARLRMPGQPPQLYGPTLTYVAPAGRRIEGTVRESGSGKPVAGITIHCGFGYGDAVNAVSDKNGHYKLENVPKLKQYLLVAWPPEHSGWLGTGARRDDEEGLRPFQIDLTVARGIVVSGRVLDRSTGKGVRGGIRFAPLPGNKFAGKPGYDSYKYDRTMRTVDASGRFKLTVIPGPGVLMVQVFQGEKTNGGLELNPYKQAEFDAKDRERVKPTENGEDRFFNGIDNSLEFLSLESAVKYIDLAPDAGTAECDLFVERGATQTVRIEDPEGKPLTGTMVAGMTAMRPIVHPIKDATCTIFALDPKKPRRLLFLHVERNLGGSLTVRGDEKEPLTARLAPVGTVTGRLLDSEGRPIVGAFVDLNPPDGTVRELYRQLAQRRPPIRTDKDGRFRLEAVVPDVQFMLNIYQGRTYFVGEPRIGVRQVKPGQTLDLGAVHVKPR